MHPEGLLGTAPNPDEDPSVARGEVAAFLAGRGRRADGINLDQALTVQPSRPELAQGLRRTSLRRIGCVGTGAGDRTAKQIWRQTRLDAVLLSISIAHLVSTLALASAWSRAPSFARAGMLALQVFMTVYSIIVVSHIFTHKPWFRSSKLNQVASMLNSINIGQSMQVYHLTHVRSHHRYNNDPKGADGRTKDLTSTFRYGKGDKPTGICRYALLGAATTFVDGGRGVLSATRLWCVGERELAIRSLAAIGPTKRTAELGQVRLDRMAQFAAISLFLVIDWRWVLVCYLPALYTAFVIVNVQNYYEHHRAAPSRRYANSVSHYGRLYNLLTFNDGYHQEHHLRPQAHWSELPRLRCELREELDRADRIVSPVPAVLGFLDRSRRRRASAAARDLEQPA